MRRSPLRLADYRAAYVRSRAVREDDIRERARGAVAQAERAARWREIIGLRRHLKSLRDEGPA